LGINIDLFLALIELVVKGYYSNLLSGGYCEWLLM
jgi:hypothetical protein